MGEDLPVENISYSEAEDFCQMRGGRLPTQAEWEYAARGPNGWSYVWGNQLGTNLLNVNWSSSQTRSVLSSPFTSDRSWVGAIDMMGNVREWTTGGVRGGSFRTGSVTSSERIMVDLNGTFDDIGFRCVRSRLTLSPGGFAIPTLQFTVTPSPP